MRSIHSAKSGSTTASLPFCERRNLRPQHIGWSRIVWDLIDRTRRSAVADARARSAARRPGKRKHRVTVGAGGRHRNVELFRASLNTPTLLFEGATRDFANLWLASHQFE